MHNIIMNPLHTAYMANVGFRVNIPESACS